MWTAAESLNLAQNSATQALATDAFAQKMIYAGDHYFMENYTTLNIVAGTLEVAIVTPDTDKWIHITWQIYSSGILTTEFYEGASGITGGNPVTPNNNNRNSSNTSGMTITSGVACSSDGTLISPIKWGGTAFKSTSGGSGVREDMIILKQNTTYLRKFISGSDSNVIGFKATWFEYTHE